MNRLTSGRKLPNLPSARRMKQKYYWMEELRLTAKADRALDDGTCISNQKQKYA